jgi:hypothetical protein
VRPLVAVIAGAAVLLVGAAAVVLLWSGVTLAGDSTAHSRT